MNPYEVLDIAKDASPDEIKKRYRKLARENHPDLNPGDAAAEERFKQISVAYDVLSDTERRRAFDEFGEVSLEAGFDADRAREAREARDRFAHRFGEHDPGAYEGSFEFGDLDEILRRFGGGAGGETEFTGGAGFGRGARGGFGGADFRMPGRDAEARLELDFAEAACAAESAASRSSARARTASPSANRCACGFRRARATAVGCAFPARAARGSAVPRPATSTS